MILSFARSTYTDTAKSMAKLVYGGAKLLDKVVWEELRVHNN